MKKPIRKVIDSLGVVIAEEEFHCHGEFKKFHKGRPNEKDVKDIAAFAKKVIRA